MARSKYSRYDDLIKRPGKLVSGQRQAVHAAVSKLKRELKKEPTLKASKFGIKLTDGLCVYPVGGDTYGGCSIACKFCFVHNWPGMRNAVRQKPKPVDPNKLFQSLFDDEDVLFYVRKGVPVELGCISDPMTSPEESLGVTLDILGMLAKLPLGVIMTTKRPDKLTDEYLKLLKETNSVVKVSFSAMNERKARLLEPGAISPLQRIEELKRIRSYGIPTVARFAPWIHTEAPYDYSLFRGAVGSIVFSPMLYTIGWRSSWSPKVWEVIFGDKAPEGEQRPGTELYEWMLERECDYFWYYRYDTTDLPWYGGTDMSVLLDPYRIREIFSSQIKRAVKEADIQSSGICTGFSSVRNIDMCSAPYCCYVGDNKYDEDALIPQWHKNQWDDFMLPTEKRSRLHISKMVTANMYVPLIKRNTSLQPFDISNIPDIIEEPDDLNSRMASQ